MSVYLEINLNLTFRSVDREFDSRLRQTNQKIIELVFAASTCGKLLLQSAYIIQSQPHVLIQQKASVIILSNYQKAMCVCQDIHCSSKIAHIAKNNNVWLNLCSIFLFLVLFQEYDRSDNRIPKTCVKTGYKLNVSILVPAGYREPVPKTYVQLNIKASVIYEGNMFQCRTVCLNNTFYIFICLLHQTFKLLDFPLCLTLSVDTSRVH